MKKRINTLLIAVLKSTKILKVLKSAKALKAFLSLATMAIFAVCHSAVMGIYFGIGLVILLFIHELGHIIALKVKGFETHLPIFIPFVGAVIFSPKFEDRHTEAYVGYGGPFLGTIAACLAWIPYFITGDHFWITISFIGIILNLFNMIPISPLDGGRITQAVHYNFKYVGLLLLLIFTLMLGEPGMLLIWMAVIIDIDTIRMKKRLQGAVGIWIIMAILTFAKVGNNYIANIVDTAAGIFLFLPIVFVLFSGNFEEKEQKLMELEEEMQDKRPKCSQKQKIAWFFYWILLIIVQLGILAIQMPMLPSLK